MMISLLQLRTFASAILVVYMIGTVAMILRMTVLSDTKTVFSPDSQANPSMDYASLTLGVDTSNKTDQRESASNGPDDIKILMHNPDVCKNLPDLRWIVYVHSSPRNIYRRAIIRRTWGNTRLFPQSVARIVFLIGMFDSASLQEIIELEFRQHGDLVQGDFRDDYHNLTLKAIMGLKWVSTYCQNARYALKVDDDAFVDVIWLYDIMRDYDKQTKVCACIIYSNMPIMRAGGKTDCSKWCVGWDIFPGREYYPSYCSGLAFVLSIDLIPELYSAALRTPTFWIDDVFVTGVLLAQIPGVHRVSLNPFFSWRFPIVMIEYLHKTAAVMYRIVHVPNIVNIERMWGCLLRQKLRGRALRSLSDGIVENSLPCA